MRNIADAKKYQLAIKNLYKLVHTKQSHSSNKMESLIGFVGVIISLLAVFISFQLYIETKSYNTINLLPEIVIPSFKMTGTVSDSQDIASIKLQNSYNDKYIPIYNIGEIPVSNVVVKFTIPNGIKKYIHNFLNSHEVEFEFLSEEITINLFDGKDNHEYKLMTNGIKIGNLDTGLSTVKKTTHSFNSEFPFILHGEKINVEVPHEIGMLVSIIANLKNTFIDFDMETIQKYPIDISISYSTRKERMINEIHKMFIVLVITDYPKDNTYTSYFKTYKQQ